MPTKVVSVQKQLVVGKLGEAVLDEYFAQDYHIFPASKNQENHQGFDRILIGKKSGKRLTIEYKFDKRASQTRNAFVELISDVEGDRQGWAYKSAADYIAYLVGEVIYLFRPNDLRRKLDLWQKAYKLRIVQGRFGGNFWQTKGVLVPLALLVKISFVISLRGENVVFSATNYSWYPQD